MPTQPEIASLRYCVRRQRRCRISFLLARNRQQPIDLAGIKARQVEREIGFLEIL